MVGRLPTQEYCQDIIDGFEVAPDSLAN